MDIKSETWSVKELFIIDGGQQVAGIPDYIVQRAIKKGIPVVVTLLSAQEGQNVKIYPIEELKFPISESPSFPNKSNIGSDTYKYYYFNWDLLGAISQGMAQTTKWDKPAEEVQKVALELATPTHRVERAAHSYTYAVPKREIITTDEIITVTLPKYIADTIKIHRELAKLSHLQLAKRTEDSLIPRTNDKRGVSAAVISRIESGEDTVNPELYSLQVIAEALNLHITDLFPPKL